MIRVLERIRAWLGGYFWLPCPNCGRMFGGHERGGGTLGDPVDQTHGWMTCNDPACLREVWERNRQMVFREEWPERYGGVLYFDGNHEQRTEKDYLDWLEREEARRK